MNQQHFDHDYVKLRAMFLPRFISCSNRTLYRVLSHEIPRRFWIHLARTSKLCYYCKENFVLNAFHRCLSYSHTTHKNKLYYRDQRCCLLRGLLIQSNYIVSTAVLIKKRYMYKRQEDYLYFDCDFDNDDDVDDVAGSNVSLPQSKIPTATPTTAATDLLLYLIDQIPATSPLPLQPSLSLFKISYIDVTPTQTTTDPSTDLDKVISSSSAWVLKTDSCDDHDTTIIPTTWFERITSYALLPLHVLIPSQFIKLSYNEDNYCTVPISKQRLDLTPLSKPSTVSKIPTPHPQAIPSRFFLLRIRTFICTTLSQV